MVQATRNDEVAARMPRGHHAAVRLTGDNLGALCADLNAALEELTGALDREPGLWQRGPRGRWTAGQHVAHVGIALARTADGFEAAEQRLRSGSLPPPARRGIMQSLFLSLVVARGHMPRGARTAPWAVPPAAPARADTLDRLGRDARRHAAIGERLGVDERDRLWIANPFLARWYYRLPEMVRAHAVHARHHRKLVEEIARGRARG